MTRSRSMMRIGFIGNIPPPVGGAEVFLRQFLGGFVGTRRRSGTLARWRRQRFLYFPEQVVRVYAPRGTVRRLGGLNVHYVFEALTQRRGERHRVFQDRLIAHYTQHGLDVARIFQRDRIQLVQAHMLYPNLFFAATVAASLGVPVVLTVHGMLEFRLLAYIRTRYPALADLVEGAIAKADAVVAVSDEVAAACRRAGARRVEKLPCGIDASYFAPPAGANGRWRPRRGPRLRRGAEEVPRPDRGRGRDLLFVGSVRREKGAGLLIQAFERLDGALEGDLVLIGTRLLKGPVVERARRNRRIRFLGVQDAPRIRQALRRARLVVLPSMSEGLPLSILEAMAAKKPVLVTRTGELAHVIQDGRNGFLIRQRSPAALADQIREVASRSDLGTIGERARRTALRFDLSRVIHRYEALYHTLIKSEVGQ